MNGANTGACDIKYGTQAERLALDPAGIKPLTEFYETDTKNYYKYFGSWVQQ